MNSHADQLPETKNHTVAEGSNKQTGNGLSTFQLVDNRPEIVAQRSLQLMANKTSEVNQLKVRNDKENNHTGNPKPVQRYVSVTSDNKDADADYVTLNSIAFANQIAGGTVENFGLSDFSGIKESEKIAFVGHGGQGSSGNYKGTEIGDKLISEKEGMPDGNHDIIFTSCDSGTRTNELKFDSTVDQVKGKIISKWKDSKSTVKGAVGPSVKTLSPEGEEQWGAIDSGKKEIAREVQKMLNDLYGLNIRDTPKLIGSVTDKAKKVQEEQRPYFMDFINIINGNLPKVSKPALEKLKASGLILKLGGGLSAPNPLRQV
jgi:hypothetical protein